MTFFANNACAIGHTPLVKLNRIVDGATTTVLAKIEGRNPSYSVKCRVGANIIREAEKKGQLKPGVEIIEATSGNTGIALAYAAAARGIPLTILMPETMSLERRKVIQMFGATLILTPGAEGMPGAVKRMEQLLAENPGKFFATEQFKNPANPKIHEETTGPEIWADTEGQVDVIVAGGGTGGTISGVTRYFKQTRNKPVTAVAVEPAESPVISQHLACQPLKPGPHKIQGIGAGFIPETLDLSLLDFVEPVSSDEAIDFARRLAREEGILSGISSGAAVAAATKIAKQPQFVQKTIVVILPDAGERYLSSDLFAGV